MSQAGILDVEAANPQIPTKFITDSGNAIPLSNQLEILGGEGINTSAAGNTVFINGEDATAGATPLLANKGISSFDSAQFIVTGGFVQLNPAVTTGILSIITNDGSPGVIPDSFGNVSLLGGNGILVHGNAPGTAASIVGVDATTTNDGVVSLATNAEAIIGAITTNHAINPASLAAKLGIQTQHGILLANGPTNAITATAEPTNGQLLIGKTGDFPILGSLTSTGLTIAITVGPGTINLESGASVPTTFTAEDSSTATPALNNLNIVGTATNGINTIASGSTVTIAMASPFADGDFSFTTSVASTDRALTISNSDNTAAAYSAAHLQATVGGSTTIGDPYINFLVDTAGTYAIGIDNSDADKFKITASANPSAGSDLFTMTSAGVITLANDLDVTEGGTGVGMFTSYAPICGGTTATGDLQSADTGFATSGFVLTSNGNAALPSWQAGGGGSGFSYEEITDANKTIVNNFEYGANRAGGIAFALPAVAATGTRFAITGILGLWSVIQSANQYMLLDQISTTIGVGGSLTATDKGDCITATCIEANLGWKVRAVTGNISYV